MPKKILVIRFQAAGDVVITLPWIQDLKDQYPKLEIHFLTKVETSGLADSLKMFSKVIRIMGGRNVRMQFAHCIALLPYLWWQRYDVILDLQNHWLSNFIRRLMSAKAWSTFDRSSRKLAGERTRDTIDAIGIARVKIPNRIELKNAVQPVGLLATNGWKAGNAFIVLNPAGAFETRNWPIENYIDFANRWLAIDPSMQFVVAGYSSLNEKAKKIKRALGSALIDITGQTSLSEVFEIVGMARLVLSEDSGLMHMAWVQRVPTVAVFGSTRSDWSAPMGAWTYCFDSSDLPCGNCMLAECLYHDNHCLTRRSAKEVFEKSRELYELNAFSASR